jgi:methyl coenzyme M reductase gamma subunit
MPTYDLDEESTLFEDLKIKVGGKTLIIPDRLRKEFDRIADINDPHKQLAAWANIKVEELDQIPMRKVAGAINIIAREFMGPSALHFTPKKA